LFPFGDILPLIVMNMAIMLGEPVFWIVVLLIGLQYWRMSGMRSSIYGVPLKSSLWSEVGNVILMGLLGGILGSLLMVFIGVTLAESGLIYLWPLAILLMLVDARFLCFAYAGGILALANLLFGFPQINVSQVLALVAVLHMVESMLIFFSGHLGAVPAFFRDRAGRVVGGFTLQKFWPIPITALAVMTWVGTPTGTVDMPDWWPLIQPSGEGAEDIVYTLMPVVAALGYGDMAIARSPRQKGQISAGYLALYSLLLLILAVLADRSWLLGVLAALFSPLGHETVIYLGRRLEMRGEPIYVSRFGGLGVLDVVPESPAWQAGLRSGNLLVQVNGVPVHRRADLEALLYAEDPAMEVVYVNCKGRRIRRRLLLKANEPLGILPVPEGDEQEGVVELSTAGPLSRYFTALWKRLRGGQA
jgi:hypothetical protein